MKPFDPHNMNGVIPAMITSFNKDENINKEGIRKTVNYLVSQNVNGLYIIGSTGETFLMSPEEKKKVKYRKYKKLKLKVIGKDKKIIKIN